MLEKEWINTSSENEDTIKELSSQLSVPYTIAAILVQRGIDTYDKAFRYFRPQISDLHDPFLMKHMKNAEERISKAIEEKEKILIYGDYDVDGTTSVAMMHLFLSRRNANIEFYIPDRYTEGYGVSEKGIRYAIENDFSLIITLDCGIKAIKEISLAKEHDIDVIICDHHTPGQELPPAYAILDPKQKDCEYPYKELSGCGVAFKLIHAYCLNNNLDLKQELFCFLDILTISIASDIVPINGENRILAYYGLKKLRQKPLTGIHSILEIAGIANTDFSISDIVFKIGPRINAAGRIESGKTAVKLLIADNYNDAKGICSLINNNNDERKAIDKSITTSALEQLKAQEPQPTKCTTVLYNENWHKGVVGIVASRLTEHYYRPTIILTKSNGLLTGSARSVDGFDLYSAIEACNELLENYGGHKYAAGISLREENLQAFTEKFESVVKSSITKEMLIPKISVDGMIGLDEITPKFYRLIKQFEPFGPGNMTPVFVSEKLYDNGFSRQVGQEKEHLKLSVLQEQSATQLDGIAFGMGELYDNIKSNSFAACYSLGENTFRGVTNLQLEIKDIKFEG